MELTNEFVKRVLKNLPASEPRDFLFKNWSFGGKPTKEGFGMLPVPGVDAERLLGRITDVDHYVGNLAHVVECRTVADAAYTPPQQTRFYQRVKIPLLGDVHHELLMERLGKHEGYEIAAWTILESETAALNKKKGMRSQYNEGCWLIGEGVVGYALSSAPRKDDVGFLKWKAMTVGADAAAPKILRENIEAMSKWTARG
ncbi:MAG: hypothetical protein JRH20_27800 [Deltaproteobacteria bacterium]|nr:hypothetical protein [Deltaproteobacteria bacterium]